MSSPSLFSVIMWKSVLAYLTSRRRPHSSDTSDDVAPSSGLVAFSFSFARRFELPEFVLQRSVLRFQPLSFHLDIFHPLRGTDRHLLDDLDKTPETQYDDERRDFLNNTTCQGINKETGNNDQGVEEMEPRSEVPSNNCQQV